MAVNIIHRQTPVKAKKPLFMILADSLREMVYSKEWQVGTKVPSEHDLMVDYHVARGTVRHAIDILVEEGILVRRHGSGTYVAEAGISHAAGVHPISFAESLHLQGKQFVTNVIEKNIIPAPLDVARELKLEAGDKVMFMRRVRTVNNKPVILQESWTNLKECPGIDEEDFRVVSLFDAVQKYSKRSIAYSKMRYQARVAGTERGNLLGCEETAALLMLEQNIHLNDHTSIEWSSTWLTPGQSIVGTATQGPMII